MVLFSFLKGWVRFPVHQRRHRLWPPVSYSVGENPYSKLFEEKEQKRKEIKKRPSLVGWRPLLLGSRPLLVETKKKQEGLAFAPSNKCLTSSNKKLLELE